jgi:hypothetical protein
MSYNYKLKEVNSNVFIVLRHVSQSMTVSLLKSVRIKNEDWKILTDHKISFDQDFVHRCVLQIVGKDNDEGKETLSVHITEVPSFLFNNTVTNQELYSYLKENPKAALFIFNKYKNNRDFIKELCDPSNPIYLEMVAENLKETFQISDAKEDIESLTRERSSARNQLNDLKKEISEKNRELDELESKIPELQKQIDDMQKLIGNLTQEETITRIKSFYESVDRFIKAAFEAQKKQPITESFNSIRLDINQINLLRVLQKSIKDDLDYILNQDLLSEKNLDAKRKEIKEKIEKEMQEGETAMLAFQLHNPLKSLNKSVSKIEEAQEQLATAGEFSRESGWFYNIHTIPNIQAILDVPKDLLNNLIQQVNTVNVRKKTG